MESTSAQEATVGAAPLTALERRILGVLAEKAKTTPDIYPLTLNSLVTGCNQKSNRDPVMTVDDAAVEEIVAGLKKKGLMQQITGSGRVDKFRHNLYDAFKLDKVQLAIITELLLRGPQTEGELRGRASRMEPIPDLDQLRLQLRGLAERGFVVYLSPEGRRGTTVTHGFHAAEELAGLRSRAESEPQTEPIPYTPTPPRTSNELELRVQRLESQLEELRAEVKTLADTLRTAAGSMGTPQLP